MHSHTCNQITGDIPDNWITDMLSLSFHQCMHISLEIAAGNSTYMMV